jgi:hypothetical protein
LYPDPLLAQVMAASTFVEQISAASAWAGQHRQMTGDALVQAMESSNLAFDPSVQALLAFPSVLDLMNQDLAWTQALGDATLVQRGDVMDAVQRMRKKAYDAGNLKSSQQITVVQSSPQVIVIQPPSPAVIYVPVYSPQAVYVASPPTGVVVAAAIGFAVAVALTPSYCNSYWGYRSGFGWSSRTVVIYNGAWGRTWVNHNVYIHTWGGYNRGFYAKPYAYVNTRVYVRKPIATPYANGNRNINVNNVNVNTVNRNTVNANTVNRNTVNSNTVNRNTVNSNTVNSNTANRNTVNANTANRNNVNQSMNRSTYQAQNPNRTGNSGNASAKSARGYTPQSSAPSGAFSGVQNGRSEQKAAARGKNSLSR